MTTYYYIDSYGTKRGPCNEQLFQELTANGSIKPTWLVEADNGDRGHASEFPDFREHVPIHPAVVAISIIGVVLIAIGLARVFFMQATLEEGLMVGFGGRSESEMLFQRSLADPFLIIGVVGIIAGVIHAGCMPRKQR